MTKSARTLGAGLGMAILAFCAVTASSGPAKAQSSGTGSGAAIVAGAATSAGASAATPAAIAAAPAVDAAASDPVPDDPTLPKKKKKKAAVAVPSTNDQPPVALASGKADVKASAKSASAKPGAAVTAVPADPTEPATTASITKKASRKPAAVTDPNAPLTGGPGCRTRSFLVNDYGKDGPTADAKRLLDADISDWTKANSLQDVKVGAKSVTCEQFLNFVVFDEWTCTASAQVCWK